MKTIEIPSLGAVPQFTMLESDPLYWLSRSSYEISQLFANMNAAELSLQKPEETDFSTVSESFGDWAGEVGTWFQQMIAGDPQVDSEGNALELPAIPSDLPVAETIALILTGGQSAIAVFVVKIAVRLGFEWLKNKFASRGSDQVEKILKAALLDSDGQAILARILAENKLRVSFNGSEVEFDIASSAVSEP